MSQRYENFIDGEWVASKTGETFEVYNPAHTDQVVAEFQQSSGADAERAIDAAVAAQSKWAATPGPDRGAVLAATAARLAARKDELTATPTREEGKTHAEAAPEIQWAIDIFR